MGSAKGQFSARSTLSAAQLESLRGVSPIDTIEWAKPDGIDAEWEKAILAVRGSGGAEIAARLAAQSPSGFKPSLPDSSSNENLQEDGSRPAAAGRKAMSLVAVESVDLSSALGEPNLDSVDLPEFLVSGFPAAQPDRPGPKEAAKPVFSEPSRKPDSEETVKPVPQSPELAETLDLGPQGGAEADRAGAARISLQGPAFPRGPLGPAASGPLGKRLESRLFRLREIIPADADEAKTKALRDAENAETMPREVSFDAAGRVSSRQAPGLESDSNKDHSPIGLAAGGISAESEETLAPAAAIARMGKGAALARSTADFQTLSLEADFVLHSRIASGGQGEIWRAWQSSLHREIAIKRMVSGRVTEFLQEAYTSAALDHPNIVPVHDLGRASDGKRETPLLAMKLVRGKPWSDQVKEERAAPGFTLDAFLPKHIAAMLDVCDAVAYAHAKGIIHRDLKPQQVMVGDFGEVFLMDWGLAVCVRETVEFVARDGIPKHRTLATAVNRCGTPAYMAPEQTWDTNIGLGLHTDIYLLGATLYQLVAGRPPHFATSAMEAFQRAASNEYDDLPLECPPFLRDLIERCLATDPAERPASVKEFREALQAYLNGADRQRESRKMVREVEAVIEAFGRENLGYEQLTLMQQRLGRALQLWPENPEAQGLHKRLMALHAERALEAHDLELSRTLALGLPESEGKARLVREIMAAEKERDLEGRRVREATTHRRRSRLTIAGLGSVIALLTIALVTLQLFHSARLAQRDQHEAAQAVESDRLIEIQRRVRNLLASEMALAREFEREAPSPLALAGPDVPAVDAAKAKELARRRARLKRERRELAESESLEPEPFELPLGEACLLLAQAAEDQSGEKIAKAFGLCREAAALRPDRPEPRTGLGVAALRLGRPQEAAQHWAEAARLGLAIKSFPPSEAAQILVLASEASRASEKDADCDKLLRESLAVLEPHWLKLSADLSSQWTALGDERSASHFARAAVPVHERRPDALEPLEAADSYRQVAQRLSRSGRDAEATSFYFNAVKTRRDKLGLDDPGGAGALADLAGNLIAVNKRPLAIPLLRKALEIEVRVRGIDHPAALERARALFDALAWPSGPKEPSILDPETVLALGAWLTRRFEAASSISVDDLRAEKFGWVAVEAAMAQAALRLIPARADWARRHLLRAEALARVAGLSATSGFRVEVLIPLANRLNVVKVLDALPRPPVVFGPGAGNSIDGAELLAHLNQASPGSGDDIDWTAPSRGGAELDLAVSEALAAVEANAPAPALF
jgi:hypothetical protein